MSNKSEEIKVKKKLIALNTSILVGLGSFVAIPSVSANYSAELQQVEKEIVATQKELSDIEQQIKRVEEAIKLNNEKIAQTENEIKAKQAEVEKLKEEIALLNEKIEKRTEILKERAKSYQESGGSVSYLEVFLGSEDFSDFIDRVFAVSKIANADADLIKQHEEDKNTLEEKQAEVDKKLNELEGMKEELEGMKAGMLEQKAQNEQLKKQLEDKQAGNIARKNEIEAQQRALQEAINNSAANESGQAVASSSSGSSDAQPASSKSASKKSSSKSSAQASSGSTYSGNLGKILSAGNKYIGNSTYVFGGGRTASDIAAGRFDCSGFVAWAFRQGGISLPASTAGLSTKGEKVSYSEARPGDLVFFDTYKKNGHVGIYLGGGKFIGSQNSTGVAIANMNSGYWKDNFNGHVRRVIN